LTLAPFADAQTGPRAAAPKLTAPKPTARKTTPRRYYRPPPVQIPANYIVRPQLADLPELVAPLENLELRELSDSYAYRRFDGKIHWGIDIFRPLGSPLYATVDGIVHLAELPAGGLTVSLTDATSEFRFYYAHLDAYPEGLRQGQRVRQGDIIGYVGTSGNARGTRPHLHFEIHMIATWMLDELGRVPVKAASLNPCPILRDLVAPVASTE
jgi:murein DD-endopeptidase MepM/ murein hydrolase activator NlpD